jgi:putative phage-type endonuclease
MGIPKLLCITKGMDREHWLECRKHGPDGDIEYTIGGSDVSVVFGENPWKAPLELYHEKKGLMEDDDTSNSNQKEMGHLMEPIVAHWYSRLTGNEVTEDYGLYQHSKYQYALANLDYRVTEPSGKKGILECKTTSWHRAGDWADDAVPHYYELQCRFYMAVMDLEFVDIACMWGTNPESDMAIRRINRDLYTEEMIFEQLDDFILKLKTETPPTMAGVNPEVALKALARVYGAGQPGLPTIELGKKYEKSLRRIAELQIDKADLERRVREKEKEVTALSVKIVEVMGNHEHGILKSVTDSLKIDFATRIARRVDVDLLKKKHPNIHEEVLKTTSSRKLKVAVS